MEIDKNNRTTVKHIKTPHSELKTIYAFISENGMEGLKERINNEIEKSSGQTYFRIIAEGGKFPNYAYNELMEMNENIVSVKIKEVRDEVSGDGEDENEISDIKREYERYLGFEGIYSQDIYNEFVKFYEMEEDENE